MLRTYPRLVGAVHRRLAVGKTVRPECGGSPPPCGRQPRSNRGCTPIRTSPLWDDCVTSEFKIRQDWPLLIFLHGMGERGNDIEKVKVHGPLRLIAAGKEFSFIVVSPQCPDDQWWGVWYLDVILEEVLQNFSNNLDLVHPVHPVKNPYF
jgi:hypothetical protein